MGAPKLREVGTSIVDLYQAGTNSLEIARQFDVRPSSIRRLLLRHGIQVRTSGQSRARFHCNERFFEHCSNESPAYWLGFLTADGNVSRTGYVTLKLQSSDMAHIEALRDALASDHPVRLERREFPAHRMSVRSPLMAADLARFGVIPNKTPTIRWPENLPPDMLRHYLRGYIDGDGGFCPYVGRTGGRLMIASNVPFLEGVRAYLHRELGLPENKLYIRLNPHYGVLQYGGRLQLRRVHEFLYKDATVYLPRKLAKLEEIIKPSPMQLPDSD